VIEFIGRPYSLKENLFAKFHCIKDLLFNKQKYKYLLFNPGVPARAEIIPFEPEQGNACEGSDKTAYILLRLSPPSVSSPDIIK